MVYLDPVFHPHIWRIFVSLPSHIKTILAQHGGVLDLIVKIIQKVSTKDNLLYMVSCIKRINDKYIPKMYCEQTFPLLAMYVYEMVLDKDIGLVTTRKHQVYVECITASKNTNPMVKLIAMMTNVPVLQELYRRHYESTKMQTLQNQTVAELARLSLTNIL